MTRLTTLPRVLFLIALLGLIGLPVATDVSVLGVVFAEDDDDDDGGIEIEEAPPDETDDEEAERIRKKNRGLAGQGGNPNDDGLFFLPRYAIGQRAYWLQNLRLAYLTPAGDIEIAGWVRNLENKIYKSLAFDATAAGLVGNIPGDPRTYGVSVRVNW